MLFCNILSFVHELYAYCEALWDNLQLIHCFYVWMFLKLVWSFLFCTLKAALEENILYCCSLLNCSIAFFFVEGDFMKHFFMTAKWDLTVSLHTHTHTRAYSSDYLSQVSQWNQTATMETDLYVFVWGGYLWEIRRLP